MSRAAPIAYGIDFGTTNSLVSVAYRDRVEVITSGRGPHPENLPSLVYMHRQNMVAAGTDAIAHYTRTGSATTSCGGTYATGPCEFIATCQHTRPGGHCHDARIVSELKAFLSDPDFDATHSWGRDFRLDDLVAVILRRLKRLGDSYTGTDVGRAVIGHPIAYPGAHGGDFVRRQGLALERMKAAAAVAGFEEVVLYQEPAAAVLAEAGAGTMVAVDFGGGTFDVAVLRMSATGGEVLALRGIAVGGEDFDAALFRHALADSLGLDGLPNALAFALSRLSTTLRALNQPGLRQDLAESGAELLSEIIFGGHAFKLFKAVEEAKIRLSEMEQTTVEFLAGRPGRTPLQFERPVVVTRHAFDHLIAADLGSVLREVRGALEDAGVEASDVDLVLRTGGSSAIPAFRDGLASIFDADKIQTRPAFSTIVAGLGQYGRSVWS